MKILQYLLIAFTCINCSTKNNKQQKSIETGVEINEPFVINPHDFEKNNLSLSVFTDDIKYIPLSNKLQIGSVLTLQITSNAVYLI